MPSAALASYVASSTAYDVDLGGPGVHRGLPSTTVTFVLPLGEPLDVAWADEPGSRRAGWSSISGLHARPARIHHGGRQLGVQLALTVAGTRALLGVPAAELSGELLELPEVAPRLRHLPERLYDCAPQRRVELVGRALLDELSRHRPATLRPEVAEALRLLGRGVGVTQVAAATGYSRRHLGALVRAECGLSPKRLQRIGRFETSKRLVGRRPLSEVAHACGYADQAHLTREWVALAGCPPSTWLSEEFPYLQDLTGLADPGLGHD